jgi:hypothetical protein
VRLYNYNDGGVTMSSPETLFDALQIQAYRKHSPLAYLIPTLRRARCFVLDDGMSEFLADLGSQSFNEITAKLDSNKVKYRRADPDSNALWSMVYEGTDKEVDHISRKLQKIIEGLRFLAKAPHAVTWIEFNFTKRWDRYKSQYAASHLDDDLISGFRYDTMEQKCGWLIEQVGENSYQCTAAMTAKKNGNVLVAPFSYWWCTDELIWRHPNEIFPAANIELAFSISALSGADINGRFALIKNPSGEAINLEEEGYAAVAQELRGELRYVWALLASINDLPVGIAPVTRSRGFIARRNYQKFMGYSTITLNLPKRMTEKRLARILVSISRRRAHEVRGHFKRVGKDKVRKWIKEHVRGDASLGWVTHNYLVKHEQQP